MSFNISSQSRAAIAGALLAVMAAGSLIAFSLAARNASPSGGTGVAARPPAAEDNDKKITLDVAIPELNEPATENNAPEAPGDSVLGLHLARNEQPSGGNRKTEQQPKQKPKQGGNGFHEPSSPPISDFDPGVGHAYGHFKNKNEPNGNAYGWQRKFAGRGWNKHYGPPGQRKKR